MSPCEIAVNVMPEETRAVVLEDGKPVEILVERASDRTLVGSIFVGRVDRVLPGMACAFVDVGLPRHAFLYVSDAAPEDDAPPELREPPAPDEDEGGDEGAEAPVTSGPRARAALARRIEDLVRVGDRIVVQVAREPFRSKGARVTTHVSLAGRFLVYLPQSSHVGISRRIQPESERERVREIVEGWASEGGGYIVRTAASGQTAEALAADRDDLRERWRLVAERLSTATPPARVHDEIPLAVKAVRDQLGSGLAKVTVDDAATRDALVAFLRAHAPELAAHVVLHAEPTPLFDALGLESDIEKSLRDRAWLKSGGYLVIDQLEALVAIDVNTGKFTGSRGLEETALTINVEAAREVARQLRLRDLGGIVVVDFIDMAEPRNRRQVMEELHAALARDRAKTTVLGMSEFGLVQITRQRQRRSLETQLTEACPQCAGSGRVRSVETTALQALRRLRSAARAAPSVRELRVKAHPAVADALEELERNAREEGRGLPSKLVIERDASRLPQSFDLLS